MSERRSKAGFLLPEIHGTCSLPIKRRGPQGWVMEACGKRNVRKLPDGTQVCAGCFNKAQRHAEAEAKASKIRAKVEVQTIRLRTLFGVEAAVQVSGKDAAPTGLVVVDPTQLLKALDKLRPVVVEQAPVVAPRRRVKVAAR